MSGSLIRVKSFSQQERSKAFRSADQGLVIGAVDVTSREIRLHCNRAHGFDWNLRVVGVADQKTVLIDAVSLHLDGAAGRPVWMKPIPLVTETQGVIEAEGQVVLPYSAPWRQ